MYLPNPSAMDTRSIIKESINGLNSIFLLQNWLPNQGFRTQSAVVLAHF